MRRSPVLLQGDEDYPDRETAGLQPLRTRTEPGQNQGRSRTEPGQNQGRTGAEPGQNRTEPGQNQGRTGTEPGQNRGRTRTEPGQNRLHGVEESQWTPSAAHRQGDEVWGGSGVETKPELQRVLESRKRDQLIRQRKQEEEAHRKISPLEAELLKRHMKLEELERQQEQQQEENLRAPEFVKVRENLRRTSFQANEKEV
ncbi:uncharacterized protein si:ch211-236d3.4 isoform X2 [Fundulus heteroclitus]|uniref:uncharacterized protein si:ch211-236d3.4 isoform X2 n=1 Tax=Fundulus heteroclitus TaxID=8078 RepID=UPI00165CB4A5|nr:uncharacterized protein si:ch211-236d3.4 isoform X2 [Fundulus heteroclitus]